MKFFDEKGSEVTDEVAETLVIRILSFLDLKTLGRSREISSLWRSAIDKKIPILPVIHRIPPLSAYPVDALFTMQVQQLKGGMTNTTFKIDIGENKWVLRLPGKGSSAFINRRDEAYNAKLASALSLNVTIDFFDGDDGLALTRFLEDNRTVTKAVLLADESVISAIARIFKDLHTSSVPFRNTINVFARNSYLFANLVTKGYSFPDILSITSAMERAGKVFQKYSIPMRPCHNDATPTNFLVAGDTVRLLDWEYSGNNDLLWDLVYFAVYSELSRKQEEALLAHYFGECNDAMLAWFDLYKPVIAWWVLLWAWTQLANHADACPVESYQTLADEYYEITKNASESEGFERALALIEEFAESRHDYPASETASAVRPIPRPF